MHADPICSTHTFGQSAPAHNALCFVLLSHDTHMSCDAICHWCEWQWLDFLLAIAAATHTAAGTAAGTAACAVHYEY
eukprot:11719-Heterococcus_DN1.PRE.8